MKSIFMQIIFFVPAITLGSRGSFKTQLIMQTKRDSEIEPISLKT